jgi:hypothetical protein
MLKNFNQPIIRIQIFIYVIFMVIVLYTSNWGVDPLHDGATFPTPVALAQGKVIFRDIQNQYGLLQGVIESFGIFLFGPYLFVQRITGSILIILISLFIYLCCAKITRSEIALGLSILYLAITPSWNYSFSNEWPLSRGTWPNSYGIFFQLVFMYLYLNFIDKKKMAYLSFCGIFLAISALARIQFFFASIFIVVCMLYFLSKKEKIILMLSYLLVVGITLLVLISQQSFSFMVQQIFIAIFDGGDNSVTFLNYNYVFKWLVALIFSAFLIFIVLAMLKTFALQVIGLTIILFALNRLIYPISVSGDGKFFSFLEISMREIYLIPIPMVMSFVAVQLLQHCITIVKDSSYRQKNKLKELMNTPIYITCTTSLLQMHNLNYGYLYYIFPVFAVCSIALSSDRTKFQISSRINLRKEKYSRAILTTVVILSFLNFTIAASKFTQHFDAPILKYMKSSDEKSFKTINSVTLFISQIEKNAGLANNCNYGLYSVNQYGYISNSRYPWNLLSSKQKYDKKYIDINTLPRYYLLCSSNQQPVEVDNFLDTNYTKIQSLKVNENENLAIYIRNLF